MTKIYAEKTVKEVVGFKCDRCEKEILRCDACELRTDNFSISYTCGYGTGYDGTRIEADICDPCLIEMVKKEIRKVRIEQMF